MEFMPHALSKEESDSVADRIESHFRQRGFGLCAVELRSNGSFLGFIGLSVPSFDAPFTPCTEVGWRLAAECWDRSRHRTCAGDRPSLLHGFRSGRVGILH